MSRPVVNVFAFAAIQCVSYFLIAVNTHAIAHTRYGLTIASDVFIASMNFFVIRKVAEAKGYSPLVGYVLGGALGSTLAIWWLS